jgi:hypothetical protein
MFPNGQWRAVGLAGPRGKLLNWALRFLSAGLRQAYTICSVAGT